MTMEHQPFEDVFFPIENGHVPLSCEFSLVYIPESAKAREIYAAKTHQKGKTWGPNFDNPNGGYIRSYSRWVGLNITLMALEKGLHKQQKPEETLSDPCP